jgi:hypothetical protein
MDFQKNVHSEEEKQTPQTDSEIKRGDTKPKEKPKTTYAEYLNTRRSE